MHPIAAALPGTDDVGPRLVLRDGSVASVRQTACEDAAALGAFFRSLSLQSRYRRFRSAGDPPEALVARLSDSSDPSRAMTLVAERSTGIIATACYNAVGPKTAEVAFAVADAFQGKGLGTALLERLAVAAVRQGFQRFEATTLEDNDQMLDVFRQSGFEIRSKSDAGGCIEVTLSIDPSARPSHAKKPGTGRRRPRRCDRCSRPGRSRSSAHRATGRASAAAFSTRWSRPGSTGRSIR